jgi:hypothetical protein
VCFGCNLRTRLRQRRIGLHANRTQHYARFAHCVLGYLLPPLPHASRKTSARHSRGCGLVCSRDAFPNAPSVRVGDAVSDEDVAAHAGALQRHPDIVMLCRRNLVGLYLAPTRGLVAFGWYWLHFTDSKRTRTQIRTSEEAKPGIPNLGLSRL